MPVSASMASRRWRSTICSRSPRHGLAWPGLSRPSVAAHCHAERVTRDRENAMPSIIIQATDGSGSFSGYCLEPKNKPTGVVVLIQEIFGVNQAMRDTAAWVADMDFIAVCPDLFWRIEPGVDITDKSDAEWKKDFELFGKFEGLFPLGEIGRA